MIPKKIYFTWISEKPIPKKYEKYIASWSRVMPDYEIHQITLENIKRGPFVDKAIAIKNYAIAGHYARVEELYLNGGIYFDIDIEAVQSLDGMLHNRLVLGREDDGIVNNAVIIAQAGHPYLKACLDYMDSTPFETDKIELTTGPIMFTQLAKKWGWSFGKDGRFNHPGGLLDIAILPPEYFYPYRYDQFYKPECVTPKTFCVHHWSNSWNNKVSIIIPCYNQGKYLLDSVESAMQQTYENVEIIIVNDGSTDDTNNIVKKLQLVYSHPKRPKIKLIEQKNAGLSAARNAGIKASSGGYILTLDADDKIHPDFLTKTIGVNDIVSTGLETFGREVRKWKSNLTNPTTKDLLAGNHINCCSLFKKDVWTITGGYDEQMRDGYEDWEFWIRATKAGFNITTLLHETLFFYRKHDTPSMLDHAKAKHNSIIDYMAKKHPDNKFKRK